MSGFLISLHPAAIEEAQAAYQWYYDKEPDIAIAFMAELDQAINKVVQNPSQWSPYLHGTRRYLLRRFPFSIVYREDYNGVLILAIAHGRRRPGYWRARATEHTAT